MTVTDKHFLRLIHYTHRTNVCCGKLGNIVRSLFFPGNVLVDIYLNMLVDAFDDFITQINEHDITFPTSPHYVDIVREF